MKKEPIWFFQFGKPSVLSRLQKQARDYKFEQTLSPRLDRAIEHWHATQPPDVTPPKIIEHPIDTEVQTGESQLLGGAMEIKSPWLER